MLKGPSGPPTVFWLPTRTVSTPQSPAGLQLGCMRALHFTVCKALPYPFSHKSLMEALGRSQGGIAFPLCTGEETESQGEVTGPWQSSDPAPASSL